MFCSFKRILARYDTICIRTRLSQSRPNTVAWYNMFSYKIIRNRGIISRKFMFCNVWGTKLKRVKSFLLRLLAIRIYISVVLPHCTQFQPCDSFLEPEVDHRVFLRFVPDSLKFYRLKWTSEDSSLYALRTTEDTNSLLVLLFSRNNRNMIFQF